MFRLTDKHRLSLIFSLYVFLFICLISVTFFIIFHLSVKSQIEKDIYRLATEVIDNHVVEVDGQIQFSKDPQGNLLKEDLILNKTSGIFFDSKLNIVRSYGIFEFYDPKVDQVDLNQILSVSEKVINTMQNQQFTLRWSGQDLIAFAYPLKSGHTVLGIGILARPSQNLIDDSKMIIFILASFGSIALLGSFILGQIIVSRSLSPIIKLSRATDLIDLDKLDTEIEINNSLPDEIVNLNRKFLTMLQRLKVTSEKRSNFIDNASHELKTPLTRAISTLDLLAMDHPQTQTEVSEVKNDLFEINDLLEKLLLLSQLKKVDKFDNRPVLVNQLVIHSLNKLKTNLKLKNIRIVEDIAANSIVHIPEVYGEILLLNLISNAIKYSNSNSEIKLTSRTFHHQTIITVEDHGIGIDRQDLYKVFDRFYRSQSGAKHSTGHGLGLSIVKEICEVFKITIGISSQKMQGTKISLTQSTG
jgi:signal transduction histidine kinase